ncbi:MAG: uncharacterized protein KVP18_000756 [Porospora cf. gigantea A]|uniref:uncharacterized protein n=1 Tax=Porospora cf. gigantea A TaxID=2853593 RepID=UPI00355A6442|nr:MAG: hypothetical protein KVP18_000756 [Porospora cf. gigantea A]
MQTAYVAFISAALYGVQTFFVSLVGPLRLLESEQIIDFARNFVFDTSLFLIFSSPTLQGEAATTRWLVRSVALVASFRVMVLVLSLKTDALADQGKTAEDLDRLFLLTASATGTVFLVLWILHGRVSLKSSLVLWVAFELTNCAVDLMANLATIALHAVELAIVPDSSTEWPERNPHLLLIELVQKIISSLITFVFFTVTLVSSTGSLRNLPLYLVGDVIQSLHALVTRSISFKKYNDLKNSLHRLEDPSLEQLEEADKCIICRDLLTVGSKLLSCGHIFHRECLRSWFSQQALCPICRAEVVLGPAEPEVPVEDSKEPETTPEVTTEKRSTRESRRERKRKNKEVLLESLRLLKEVTAEQQQLVDQTRDELLRIRET